MLRPPLLLMALTGTVPVIIRAVAKVRGIPTGLQVELAVQQYFFAFLFIQVFLIVGAPAIQ
jgi:hypothetical protein